MNGSANLINHDDRLKISGDLNFSSVPKLWQQSLALLSRCKELNFDFSDVTSVSSAGLALLIEWQKYAVKNKKPCRFFHVPSQLISIADAAGIKNLIATEG